MKCGGPYANQTCVKEVVTPFAALGWNALVLPEVRACLYFPLNICLMLESFRSIGPCVINYFSRNYLLFYYFLIIYFEASSSHLLSYARTEWVF